MLTCWPIEISIWSRKSSLKIRTAHHLTARIFPVGRSIQAIKSRTLSILNRVVPNTCNILQAQKINSDSQKSTNITHRPKFEMSTASLESLITSLNWKNCFTNLKRIRTRTRTRTITPKIIWTVTKITWKIKYLKSCWIECESNLWRQRDWSKQKKATGIWCLRARVPQSPARQNS